MSVKLKIDTHSDDTVNWTLPDGSNDWDDAGGEIFDVELPSGEKLEVEVGFGLHGGSWFTWGFQLNLPDGSSVTRRVVVDNEPEPEG